MVRAKSRLFCENSANMMCPSCNSRLEPNARFCGVCGYRLAPTRPPNSVTASPAQAHDRLPRNASASAAPGAQVSVRPQASGEPATRPAGAAASAAKQPPRAAPKPRAKLGDEIYINQVLNNRFKVESKIGEGGFGAVYRGVQLQSGRKVALKLLHPEMTKDENLVARFRREGMVLCNLRDAHTITTYDFDQTPDGTLYIAMELLEGKSLHEIFHQEAPLDWRRVFKILTEMCSSLAEAHAQGIVHRDLKPENIYLETRPGNPEFVKILDFGIAKVMRGDSIDPQSAQLTATGQTLGTLEYMSPEQLMGKPLDGRSDVYALGVLAYEMITGRLPFPDAKGPAGLITAQLKQTPLPPSQAQSQATLPPAADRAILKCLEKDKTNRYPDVSALALALNEVMAQPAPAPPVAPVPPVAAVGSVGPVGPVGRDREVQKLPAASLAELSSIDMMETRRGELPNMSPPPMPSGSLPMAEVAGASRDRGAALAPPPAPAAAPAMFAARPRVPAPGPPMPGGFPHSQATMFGGAMGAHPQQTPARPYPPLRGANASSKKLIWWVLALLVVGAGVGTAMALLFGK